MQYRGALLVPAGTTAAASASLVLAACYGVLKRFIFYFPPGHAGTVHLQVWYRGRQILPTTLGETFRGDDLVIDLPETFPVYDPPFELTLLGWSPDASYDHAIYTIFYIDAPALAQSSILESNHVALPNFGE